LVALYIYSNQRLYNDERRELNIKDERIEKRKGAGRDISESQYK